jgi:AraC family transcriptional regulator of adaptative response/methylated-DNA-[protein]-cysteine methyltransferase
MNSLISDKIAPLPAEVGGPASTESLSFAVRASVLGQILVARSVAGVCAILIGDDQATLEEDLAARFPNARLVMDAQVVGDDLAKLIDFLEAPSQGLDLPLDVRGTAFQRRVWEALRTIPAGTTISYADLARRIDAPGAVRAVAGACAGNPIALAVPCHRVVRSDGALSGYRWGVGRKRALLQSEAAA